MFELLGRAPEHRPRSASTSSDWEPSAFETRAESIGMCRKRSFATRRRGCRPASAAVCRRPCQILCLVYVERVGPCRAPNAPCGLHGRMASMTASPSQPFTPTATRLGRSASESSRPVGRDATHVGRFSAVATSCQRRDEPSARISTVRYAARTSTIPLHPAMAAARVPPAPPARSHHDSIGDRPNRGGGPASTGS